jgi:hypothetical protein
VDPSRQIIDRMSPRAFYPGDILHYLWKFKHPRIQTLGISRTNWGRDARESVGIQDHGTLWVAGRIQRDEIKSEEGWEFPQISLMAPPTETKKEWLVPIVCNCIPYTTIAHAKFDPDLHRFRGQTVRGWRPLFSYLAKLGVLRSSPELDYMIGERTWEMVPRELRV